MPLYDRENNYIELLSNGEMTVKELAEKLYISEPTVRRDITVLQKKDILVCKRGKVKIKAASPDKRIPYFIRDMQKIEEKRKIAQKASEHIKDGYTVMLDASTTCYCLLPHLAQKKNIILITNGAKTALAAAGMGIHTIAAGGELKEGSFCFVGSDAEKTVGGYNADVFFFSCRGVDDKGNVTDSSVYENAMRKVMAEHSKKKILLYDTSKFGATYLNTVCNIKDLDAAISEK